MFWKTVYPTVDNRSKKRSSEDLQDLREFEKADVVSEVVECDEDEPSSLAISSFDWDNGRYFKSSVWLVLLVQLFLSLVATLIGLMLSKSFAGSDGGYSIWDKPGDKRITKIELTRGLVQLGIPALVYSILQLFFCIVPLLMIAFAKLRGKNCPGPATRLKIDRLLKLRRSIGMAVFGIVAAALSRRLFKIQPVKTTPSKDDGTTPVEGTQSNPVLAFGANLAAYMTENNFDFFANRFFLSLAIILFMIFLEKFFILQVGVIFHREGFSKRQTANRFFRKIVQGLCKHFIKSNQAANPKAPSGELIFDAIGKPKLGVNDFKAYMDEDEAEAFFLQLDEEGGGAREINREEFIAGVDRLKNEEKAINKALLNSSGLIGKLDSLLVVLLAIVSSIVVLVVFEPPLNVVFTYLISVIASLVFLFGSTAKTLFESITYVIFNHPFDQDDWLLLADGILYQVKEIGLVTSSFLTPQNDLVYMNNLALMNQTVVNLKRSAEMSEVIKVSIMPDTPKEKIAQLEAMCKAWLKERPQFYLPKFTFRDFLVRDNVHLTFSMRLWHRANFDDMTKKDHRARLFVLFLKESMENLQIKASPPVLPGSVKPFA